MMNAPDLDFQASWDRIVERRNLERDLAVLLKKGGDYGDIFIGREENTRVVMVNGEITEWGEQSHSGAGFRVINGGCTGFASSHDLSPQSMNECADAASAHVGRPPRAVKLRNAGRLWPSTAKSERLDPLIRHMRMSCDRAMLAEQSVRQVVCQADIHMRFKIIANSAGVYFSDRSTVRDLHVYVTIEKSNSTFTGHRFGSSTDQLSDLAKDAARMAVEQVDARDIKQGSLPVVLGPGWCGMVMHEAVGHALEADFVLKGESVFSGRMNDQIASELVTIVDDATMRRGRASCRCDDEGTQSKPLVLVEKGVLKNFMSDRWTALLGGTSSTGHGRRAGFDAPPLPRMTNTFLMPGQDDPTDIIRSVQKGVYVASIGKGAVNIHSGDFSFWIERGYLIEDGRLGRPIKNTYLTGHGPSVLRNIDRVGSDSAVEFGAGTCFKEGQIVPVSVGQPTVRIRELLLNSPNEIPI
ncbi:MAG: TldD/PmbA family protein [Bacteroidetes bacterium]|nr:TldD/PmbA family protein [Bacteroidota bacterium]